MENHDPPVASPDTASAAPKKRPWSKPTLQVIDDGVPGTRSGPDREKYETSSYFPGS